MPTEPYALPEQCVWDTFDLNDDAQMQEFFKFLGGNYVGSDGSPFQYEFGIEILRWALLVPGAEPDWIVGVRESENGPILGVITGIPLTMSICGKVIKCAMINFLAVRKDVRRKRLAPTLISEITRRVNRKGIF